MAEITTQNSNGKKGLVKKMIKRSTRVDLTPMVDLGFLLVTFFVFTSALSEPKAMKMVMPKDTETGNNTPICESCALTVVLAKNNRIFYYEGSDVHPQYQQTTYASDGLRKLITDKKKKVDAMGRQMQLIIKSSDGSSFKNLVNVIDESNIAMVPRFFMQELNEEDKKVTQ